MKQVRWQFAFLASVPFAIAVPRASAQCLDWEHGFGGIGAQSGAVFSVASMQSGGGSLLFIGGDFTIAGGLPASRIASWDGASWTPLANSVNGRIRALAVFDDGSGPALYAGGEFTSINGTPLAHVAKWNGSSWSAVGGGTDGSVYALTAYDDGSGSSLYAGGLFANAGGTPANDIARWNGSAWSALASGMNGPVRALATLVTGTHRELAAGGTFQSAGGTAASNVAKWDGSAWSALSSGTDGDVYALSYFDDHSGNGRELHAGGGFSNAGGGAANHVAKWNGTTWVPLSCGVDNEVDALAVYSSGGVSQLYVGGYFAHSCSAMNRIARWDGTTWTSVGGGANSHVHCLAVHNDPAIGRSVLVAGGVFFSFGVPSTYTNEVAEWDGSQWNAVGGQGVTGTVQALQAFTPSSGTPTLVAGGTLNAAGSHTNGTSQPSVFASWNGAQWSFDHSTFLTMSPSIAYAAAVYDDGTGQAVYIGGSFQLGGAFTGQAANIVRFDGTTSSPVGPGSGGVFGTDGAIHAMLTYDDGSGPSLFAAGAFSHAGTTGSTNQIAKWTSAGWSPLGLGLVSTGLYNASCNALCVFDEGTGPALYAAGIFDLADTTTANDIARWNGSNWTPLGSGIVPGSTHQTVEALAVFDDGTGPALYVGGAFGSAGGVPTVGLAKWNGTTWSAAGPVDGYVASLRVFDDGSGAGPALYVGGGFDHAGGVPATNLARFDGTTWTAVGGGTNDVVVALGTFDQGADGALDLFAAGMFTQAGTEPSFHIAEWRGCGAPGTPFCAGDGSLATPCPCNNSGAPGHGCDNSHATSGALLATSGMTQPDSVHLTSSFELPSALSIFLQGNASIPAGTAFGDGLRCVAGNLKRLASNNANGGVVFYPGPGDPSITVRSAQLGDPIAPGSTRYYQVYYRDPNPSFCPSPMGNTWNVSNGAIILW